MLNLNGYPSALRVPPKVRPQHSTAEHSLAQQSTAQHRPTKEELRSTT
jgi:hypothetical protein